MLAEQQMADMTQSNSLQGYFAILTMDAVQVYRPVFTLRQDVDPPLAIASQRLAYLLDPMRQSFRAADEESPCPCHSCKQD